MGKLLFRLIAGMLAVGTAAADPAPTAQTAIWKDQELIFEYMGFTTHYSCEGLRNELRQMLLALGARADLKVNDYGCAYGGDRPEPFPSLQIRMATLQAAAPGTAGALEASWQSVDVARQANLGGGDCELVEDVIQKILPLFSTRKLGRATSCIPHQLPVGGLDFRLEVLLPAR
jgi:hypothetical protein